MKAPTDLHGLSVHLHAVKEILKSPCRTGTIFLFQSSLGWNHHRLTRLEQWLGQQALQLPAHWGCSEPYADSAMKRVVTICERLYGVEYASNELGQSQLTPSL